MNEWNDPKASVKREKTEEPVPRWSHSSQHTTSSGSQSVSSSQPPPDTSPTAESVLECDRSLGMSTSNSPFVTTNFEPELRMVVYNPARAFDLPNPTHLSLDTEPEPDSDEQRAIRSRRHPNNVSDVLSAESGRLSRPTQIVTAAPAQMIIRSSCSISKNTVSPTTQTVTGYHVMVQKTLGLSPSRS